MFDGYKTGEGIDPDLRAQFELAEQAVAALGIVVWPMVEFEADDAIATAAVRFKEDAAVEQVVICSPDKDLANWSRDIMSYVGIAAAIFSMTRISDRKIRGCANFHP